MAFASNRGNLVLRIDRYPHSILISRREGMHLDTEALHDSNQYQKVLPR
jgi:hypothetical protein